MKERFEILQSMLGQLLLQLNISDQYAKLENKENVPSVWQLQNSLLKEKLQEIVNLQKCVNTEISTDSTPIGIPVAVIKSLMEPVGQYPTFLHLVLSDISFLYKEVASTPCSLRARGTVNKLTEIVNALGSGHS